MNLWVELRNNANFHLKTITKTINVSQNQLEAILFSSFRTENRDFPFPIDIFWLMAEREVYPFELELYKINSSNFRAIFRAIFIYFTFCRFSDFSILTDRDFTDHGHFVEVVFKKSKNDQYHEGTNSILAR